MAYSPTHGFPRQRPAKDFKFKLLPENLRNKIERQPGRGPFNDSHWLWTGAVRASKPRLRMYRTSRDPEGRWQTGGCYENDRETPRCRDPHEGGTHDAHRVVYGLLTCTSVLEVPVLQRCAHSRCVNPQHMVEIAPPRGQRQPPTFESLEVELRENQNTAVMTDDEIVELLRKKDASPYQMPDEAASECGLPPGSISFGALKKYAEWCEEHDRDDDS